MGGPCALLPACLQIDPQALDDGAGDDDGSKLWHQQALASGAERTPLDAAVGTAAAAAGSGASDATMKVSKSFEQPCVWW